MAATCGAQMPQAITTTSASIRPVCVRTACTAPRGVSSMPVTRVSVSTLTPSSRAALASAKVAVCGSSAPSPGPQTAPKNDSVLIASIHCPARPPETTSTPSPLRLALRMDARLVAALASARRAGGHVDGDGRQGGDREVDRRTGVVREVRPVDVVERPLRDHEHDEERAGHARDRDHRDTGVLEA